MHDDAHVRDQAGHARVGEGGVLPGVDHAGRRAALAPRAQEGQGAMRLDGIEGQQQVGIAFADQRAFELAHLQVGGHRAAALGHAEGLRAEHRDLAAAGDFGKDFGGEQHALAADAGDHGLAFHGRTSMPPARGRIAPWGQTWMQTPQAMQVRSSMLTRPSGARSSEGHSNQVVQ
jgi:hypothetical protein